MLPSAHTHRDRTFEGLAVHDHVCAIGESLQQQLDTAAAFLRIGLARGDRCIYITHENPPAAILQALRAAQVEVEPPLKSGALQVVTKSETYIKPGHFDPDWMLDYLAQACAASRRAGFPVTRVAGEASWILDGDRGAERFMEYEARVDALMRDFDLITLCQYNVTRFDAQTLLHAIGTHPLIVVGDICTPNPYYLPNNPTDGTSDGSLHLRRVLRAVQQCGRLEQEVRNNERLLRQFINASPDWALLLDLEGRVISCNEAMARRMHRPVEEILNRQFGEILDAQTAQVSGAYYERAIATASPYHWTDQRLGRRYDHYATPILDGNGQVRLVALFVHDITEHELTQERNQALSEQLRQAQKMQAVGQLAGGVAHNFNNLLLAISGNAELVADVLNGGDWPRERQLCLDSLAQVHKAVDLGAELTGRLLTFCQERPFVPVVLEVNTVLSGMISEIANMLGPGITLQMDLDEQVGPVRNDPRRFEEAILSLVLNAREAMPAGGVVTLRTMSSGTIRSDSSDASAAAYTCIRLSDSGRGMEEAVRSRLFEPFFTTKPLGQGTGLSLAVLYGFMSQSGGHVDVESRPGQGTAVTLWFPTVNHTAATAPPQDTAAGACHHVLICDEDTMSRQLMTDYLGHMGFQVTEATDAASAWGVIHRKQPVDVLVVNFHLTGTSGSELALGLQARRPKLACVLIAAERDANVERAVASMPHATLLCKPFPLPALLDAIRACVHQAG